MPRPGVFDDVVEQLTDPPVDRLGDYALQTWQLAKLFEFELNLIDGNKFSSEDLISEGRPVFLFFTASW